MFAGSRLLLPVLTNCVTLTFMNVDGAFILAETRRKSSVLLFVDNSMQIFLRYISLRIWEDVCHRYHIVKRKNNKKEQLPSKCFSADFPRALDFEPWRRELVQRCLNDLHAICVCFRKHNILQFIY